MKGLVTLISSFLLLGSLVSCGSGNSTSSGVSSNAGSTSVVNNSCTAALKNYIETYAGKLTELYGAYGKSVDYVTVNYRNIEGYVWNGNLYTQSQSTSEKQVNSGANKSYLLNLANTATSCSHTQVGTAYTGTPLYRYQLQNGTQQVIIDGSIAPEANPVQYVERDDENFTARQVLTWVPEGYKSYTITTGDLWQKIKDLF